MGNVERFLMDKGFVVLTRNGEDPSPGMPFEAWAYEGALHFDSAEPVTFGLGGTCPEALEALDMRLAEALQHDS